MDPVPRLQLTPLFEKELVLLLALHEKGRAESMQELGYEVERLGFWRGVMPSLVGAWDERCVGKGYVNRSGNGFELTDMGLSRLLDLCTLAYAMDSPNRHLTSTGYLKACQVRGEIEEALGKRPFTNREVSQLGYQEKRYKYHVYVVLLRAGVMENRHFLSKINPVRNMKYPCLYVGYTGRTPEIRFRNHKKGYYANKLVRNYGICLVPDLYAHINPINGQEAAIEAERQLADSLRKQGYAVSAGHHDWNI